MLCFHCTLHCFTGPNKGQGAYRIGLLNLMPAATRYVLGPDIK
jgi:hypothetical protein